MTVSYTKKNGDLEIELVGDLGHHEAIEAMENISALYESALPKNVVLNMGGLTFMDSSGIAVVMKAKKLCDGDGVSLTVQNTPKQALKVLTMAGITNLVRFI